MKKSHEIVIQKALDYMKMNLARRISIEEVARHAGISNSYLRSIFLQYTGKGPLSHLSRMRIQKAKDLLQDTALSISEISYAAGFNGLGQFSLAFRKKVGCSPTDYRRSMGAAQKPQADPGRNARNAGAWNYEPLTETSLAASFRMVSGDWRMMDSWISGRAEEQALIQFAKPLPENFRVSFEVRPVPWAGSTHTQSPQVIAIICNAECSATYSVFALSKYGGAVSEFRPHGFGSQQIPGIILERDQWHRIEIDLQNETLRLCVNGTEVFWFRDPFPPLYSLRSHIALGTYQGKIDIREFKVFDMGLSPLVPGVRQGDSLYNAGQFSAARDFYLRLLSAGNTTEDLMELRYKIARCFLAEREYLQARNWLDKVIRLPETVFWADWSDLARLEADVKEGNPAGLEESVKQSSLDRFKRQGIREILDEAAQAATHCGFYEKAREYQSIVFEMEEPESFPFLLAGNRLADTLTALRRFDEAEKLYRMVIDNSITPRDLRQTALFSVYDSLGFQGKRREWEDCLAQLEPLVKGSISQARYQIARAHFFQATGDFNRVLLELNHIETCLPWANTWRALAKTYSAWACCCMGDVGKARKFLDEAVKLDPSNPRLNVGWKSMWYYPVELVSGNFEKAAEFLLADSQMNQTGAVGAEQTVKAGLMYSLAGDDDKAILVWKKACEVFIERRICFWGSFSKELAKGNLNASYEMPYPAEKRSELFYLLGLLCEMKNDRLAAEDLFSRSAAEDLTAHWPAWLAGRKLRAR